MKYLTKVFFILFISTVVLTTGSSCKKFLDAKTDSKIDTPRSITDLEGMLNYYFVVNAKNPMYGEFSSDNIYLSDASWASALDIQRALYCWQKFDGANADWFGSYQGIFYCNVIIESLSKIDLSGVEESRMDNVRGSALFLRAFNHFALAQLFTKPFDSTSADTDLGLPIKINSDYNEHVGRASVMETYNQIIKDYKECIPLLPIVPATRNLASRPAAYAALSRLFMSMRDYRRANLYADSCLELYKPLLDYNTVNANAAIPFMPLNDEIIFDARTNANAFLGPTYAKIDSVLYKSYDNNDLRKLIFFKKNSDGSISFKGQYTGNSGTNLFCGLATDEIYLTKAECCAREGDRTKALLFLDSVLIKRYKTGQFAQSIAPDAQAALTLILNERRKELVFRTIRWMDLRRLNFEDSFKKSLVRYINGQVFTLEPNSLRYVLLIPDATIKLSGLVQNP